MLERMHGMFDADKCDLVIEGNSNSSVSDICIIIENELNKICD
jgi:hypothetical protein